LSKYGICDFGVIKRDIRESGDKQYIWDFVYKFWGSESSNE